MLFKENILIEPASRADLTPLIPIHEQAFKGTMGAQLGKGYIRAYIDIFLQHKNAIFLLAKNEQNNILGYALGLPSLYEKWVYKRLLFPIGMGLLTHPKILMHPHFLQRVMCKVNIKRSFQEYRKKKQRISKFDEHDFGLFAIGVALEKEGRGIGQSLLHSFENKVWDLGYSRIILCAHTSNGRAVSLYQKCSWKKYGEEKGTTYFQKLKPGEIK